MSRVACLWMRPRLESYADAALPDGTARRVEAHLAACAGCHGRVRELHRLRGLLRAAATADARPLDWSTFWPAVSARIAREQPAPVRDPWWLPLWRPVWGHPRLALSGAMVAVLALTLSLWPVDDGGLSSAWAGPVVVQDVSSPDPDHTVMVYSSPDRTLTVIWVFAPDGMPVAESPSP